MKPSTGYTSAKRSASPLDSAFLANRDGTMVGEHHVDLAFARLREAAGVRRRDDGGRGPCLHALRHTAAVHRLTARYREGADVQRLLPALSTYLGHADLDGTRVCLSMTPDLLQEASVRFDRYANGGSDARPRNARPLASPLPGRPHRHGALPATHNVATATPSPCFRRMSAHGRASRWNGCASRISPRTAFCVSWPISRTNAAVRFRHATSA